MDFECTTNSKKKLSLDTSFDPSDTPQTLKFVAATFQKVEELSQAEIPKVRRRLTKQLSAEQWQAVADVIRASPHTIEQTQPTTNRQSGATIQDISTLGYNTYPYEFSCYLSIPIYGNVKAYDFKHTISWAYNGNSISEPEASSDGTGHGYGVIYWTYKGSTRDDINNAGNHFTSEKTGRFENCVPSGDVVCDTDHAYSKLLGDATGAGAILEYNCEVDQ